MMTKNFGIGILGRKQFQEKWSKTTDSESFECDSVSAEDIEDLCEEWWMKSSEEKQIFVEKLNLALKCKTSQIGTIDLDLTECN